MPLVKAAIAKRRKKTELQNQPKWLPMELKISGMIWKTRFGPWSIGMPTEKTAGKIASPAIIATTVSRMTIIKLLAKMFFFESR